MAINLPKVNIIIVTYNFYDFTRKCLASLFQSTYENIEIILVDNGSEESIYQEFFDQYKSNPKIKFVRSEVNLGFGGGCNLGAEEVKEGYVVFLNNDTEVARGWLEPIISYMEAHQDVGACQPKLLDLRKKNYFEYAGAAGGYMDVYGYPFCRGRIFYTVEEDRGQYDSIVDLVWCSGTALVTKKEILDKVGYFDETFFMYGEEADLCWRMNRAGYRLVFIPGSVVYHYGMGTMEKNSSYQKIFYLHRNGLILLFKNYSGYQLLRFFPTRIILDFVAFWYYLYTYPLNSLSIIRAYFSFFVLWPRILKQRKIKNGDSNKKIKSVYPLYPKSIILEYFIFQRKKFSEIFKII